MWAAPLANPVTFNFTFGASVTLGPTGVLTQGAAHLDFTDAGGSTCTANTSYSTGATCGVNVTFKPTVPGPRYGAAVLQDTSGNPLATGYMQGTGIGPRVNFLPGTQSTLGSLGFFQPVGVAVDGSGNVYVADRGTRSVKETLAPNYTTVNTLASGFSFSFPVGLAVDGSGNVYFAIKATAR